MQEKEAARLASDICRGVKAIAREIGLTERQTYHALEQRHIPAGKEGATWVASKARLREHYAKLTAGQAA